MDPQLTASAEKMRRALATGSARPEHFRAAVQAVPALDRDAWVDRALGIDDPVPADGDVLPRDGVAYLPCSVANLLESIRLADITRDDVVVDVGSGIGRAAAFLHHATGADTVGVEIQPHLAEAAVQLAGGGVETIVGDAVEVVPTLVNATVFFLYCPFSGRRLEAVIDAIGVLAERRTIRLCCVGLADLERCWLERRSRGESIELAVYASRSTLND